MANKKTREEEIKKERIRQYNTFLKRLNIYPFCLLTGIILTALLFFVKFGYIYNTDMNNGFGGTEVSFTGFNLFIASLNGKFSDASKVYGDIAVPFYYYAKSYIESLSVFMIVLAISMVLTTITTVIIAVTKKHILSFVLLIFNLLNSGLLLTIYIKALSMKNSKILPTYCSGNPACSIRSLAIIPTLFSLLLIAVSGYYVFKFIKSRKMLK